MCQLDICWKRCQVAYDGGLDCLREDGFSAKVMLVLSPICNEETTCKIWRRYIRKVLGSGTLGTRQAIPCWGSQKGHTLPLPMGKYRSSGPGVGRSVWKRPVRTCRECASPLSPHVWMEGQTQVPLETFSRAKDPRGWDLPPATCRRISRVSQIEEES